jgi:hypothetical protein
MSLVLFSSAYCAVCVLQTKVLYLCLPQYGSNIYGSVRQYADIMCDKTTYRIFVAAMRCSFSLTDCYFGAANSSCVSKCSQLTFCTWRTEQDMAVDRKTYPLCSEIFVSYFVCRNNPVFLVKLSTYSDMLFISFFLSSLFYRLIQCHLQVEGENTMKILVPSALRLRGSSKIQCGYFVTYKDTINIYWGVR